MNFEEQLARYQKRCELSLHRHTDLLFQKNSKVSDAACYGLLQGGKRVRGVLVLAVCDLLGGSQNAAESYATALEMVHAFSLIHDDLPCMDDDDLRRGKPATHIQFGEATALLAGDLLVLQAFEAIAIADIPAENRIKAVQHLAKAAGACGMIYGQELDLHHEIKPANEKELYQIHRHKTGALMTAAVQLGCCTAPIDEAKKTALTYYADQLGLAFQIVDDILDITSSAAVLGKPIGSDSKQGKTTFVSLFGEEESRQKAEMYTQNAIHALQDAFAENTNFLIEFTKKMTKRLF